MKNEFTYENIYSDLQTLDAGCCYIGEGQYKKDKEIILDNDNDGNAQYGWLNLKVEKDKIKIVRGSKLEKGEKKVWKFKDYNSVEELNDDICDFTNKYFKSFVVVRKK